MTFRAWPLAPPVKTNACAKAMFATMPVATWLGNLWLNSAAYDAFRHFPWAFYGIFSSHQPERAEFLLALGSTGLSVKKMTKFRESFCKHPLLEMLT